MDSLNYNVPDFRLSLAETVAWFSYQNVQAGPEHLLRSLELRPPDAVGGWPDRVASLRQRRQQLLLTRMKTNLPDELDLPNGHLLVFDPGQSLSDGAAEVESNGFFDADNVPPWDLWVSYIEERQHRSNSWTRLDSFLLCWIPPAFTELVERSIAVNPEQCIQWASNVDSPFIQSLRSTNLLF